jgi:predicted transposase YdaD
VTTDPIFYRLFETSPETFFLLLGISAKLAADTAARYEYKALEFKETSHRTDGVFLPREAGLPLYFLEVQFYRLPSIFADLLAKVYTYLKQHDPGQSFCGVVLFASRNLGCTRKPWRRGSRRELPSRSWLPRRSLPRRLPLFWR